MGLFGLFKKKNKTPEVKPVPGAVPMPPKPPGTTPSVPNSPSFSVQTPMNKIPEPVAPKQTEMRSHNDSIEQPRSIDDFGIPEPGMEIPDFELPDLEIQKQSSEEITQAIKKATIAEKEIKEKIESAQEEAPEELPQIEIVDTDDEEPSKPVKETKSKKQLAKPIIEVPVEEPAATVQGSIFVSSTQFSNVKNTISAIKGNLKNTESGLNKLNGLKNAQDSAYESWHNDVEAIQRKLIKIDTMLFEKGQI